jgi:sugar diacid utilization regulator
MEFINQASTHAADAYLDAQQMLVAEGDRARRDLLENLLSGIAPATQASRAAAREAGLEPSARCVVLVAVRSGPIEPEPLRSAVAGLVRAVGGPVRPLSVVRQDEIVIVRSLREGDVGALPDRMRSVQRELVDRGARIAIGVSTVHEGTAGLPAAYQEARDAAESVEVSAGVLALTELSVLDYFASRGDQVAARLLSPGIRAFVEQDLKHGGALTDTVLAYSEADMSLTRTAEALHVHVNTARYRLARVAELTGSNVKRFNDIVDLVIAIKLSSAMRHIDGL